MRINIIVSGSFGRSKTGTWKKGAGYKIRRIGVGYYKIMVVPLSGYRFVFSHIACDGACSGNPLKLLLIGHTSNTDSTFEIRIVDINGSMVDLDKTKSKLCFVSFEARLVGSVK